MNPSSDDSDHKQQGKIHTENADLLSLLTEDSSDSLNKDTKSSKKSDRNNNYQRSHIDSSGHQDNSLAFNSSNVPQPKASSLLPVTRESSGFKDHAINSSSSVYAVANPDILRASGITPVQPNHHFPRYVSLKSSNPPTPRGSTAQSSSSVEDLNLTHRVSPVKETPEDSFVLEKPEDQFIHQAEFENESKYLDDPGATSLVGFSVDSLDVPDEELERLSESVAEYVSSNPTTPKPPSVVIEEDTSSTSETRNPVVIDKNLLQIPKRNISPKSQSSSSQDSLSPRVSTGDSKEKTDTDQQSEQGKVYVVSDAPGSTMSEGRNRKVYVESPTFTKEEEDEYRFVSSRIDDYNDMNDTYRHLDEKVVEQKSKKKSSGKRVRYQDSDRFEDKNQLDIEEDIRFSRQTQGHGVTHKSALKNSSRQDLSQQSPVRGLKLPDKNNLDPEEEEELRQETAYQDELKHRLDASKRDLEYSDVPKLPLSPETERELFRDSLDMAGEAYVDNRGKSPRDSLELYKGHGNMSYGPDYGEMENTAWRNPPPQPFSAPPFESTESVPAQFHRQNAVDGYASEPEPRNQDGFEYGYPEPQSKSNARPDILQVHSNQEFHNPRSYINQGVYQEQIYGQPPNHHHDYPQVQQQGQMNQSQAHYQVYGHPQNHHHGHGHIHDYPEVQQQGQLNPSQTHFQNSGYHDNSPSYSSRNPHVSSFMPENHQANMSYDSDTSYRPYYNEQNPGYQNGTYGYNNVESNIDSSSGYYSPRKQSDQYRLENTDSGMEEVKLLKPTYDYVRNNKYDYGKHPPKSYKQIKDIHNEEKVKLESIFVKPKVKSKQAVHQNSSAKTVSSVDRVQEPHQRPMNQKPASAEDLWAQRAASLQQRSAGKPAGRGRGRLVKYPSDGGFAPLDSRLPPPRPAFVPAGPVVNVPAGPMVNASPPHSFPNSPTRRPLELKPISQEVVTTDGQRISVDVNLRLVSPPAPFGPAEGYSAVPGHYIKDITDAAQARPGQQYPIMDYPVPQQDYPEGFSDSYSGALPAIEAAPDNTSSRDNHSIGNSYARIPPIPSSSESNLSEQRNTSDEGGYVAQFRRQKEKQHEGRPWYKVYNLSDYKKMQKEVQLGTLGPDLDNNLHKERAEKAQRQSHYARMVMERNKQELTHKKPPSYPKPQDLDGDIMNKRRVALEYAKNVPKPAVKPQPNPYNSYEVSSQVLGSSSNRPYKQPVVDIIDLDKLQQRHERDKENVAKIRQNMDSAVAQNA